MSPISIIEFRSWVFIIVVMPSSLVSELIRWSITMAVSGSSPELGSSQNRKVGFKAMALAIPTLFCIPPESSSGYLSSLSLTLTLSRRYLARSSFSALLQSVRKSIGNITLPRTVRKSKRALPWKSIPIFW